MEITEVKVFPVKEEKLKAFVSIVFDDCFMVNDIKIIQGHEGRFISMPSRRKKNGDFKDIAHPLNNEARGKIEARVLSEYDNVVGGSVRPQMRRVGAALEGAGSTRKSEPTTPEDTAAADGEAGDEKTMEEIAEVHLRDSFWTT